jgi:hypothetical protein
LDGYSGHKPIFSAKWLSKLGDVAVVPDRNNFFSVGIRGTLLAADARFYEKKLLCINGIYFHEKI